MQHLELTLSRGAASVLPAVSSKLRTWVRLVLSCNKQRNTTKKKMTCQPPKGVWVLAELTPGALPTCQLPPPEIQIIATTTNFWRRITQSHSKMTTLWFLTPDLKMATSEKWPRSITSSTTFGWRMTWTPRVTISGITSKCYIKILLVAPTRKLTKLTLREVQFLIIFEESFSSVKYS